MKDTDGNDVVVELRKRSGETGEVSAPLQFHEVDFADARDQFGMAALTGLLTAGPHDCTPDELAVDAWMYADAMMAKR